MKGLLPIVAVLCAALFMADNAEARRPLFSGRFFHRQPVKRAVQAPTRVVQRSAQVVRSTAQAATRTMRRVCDGDSCKLVPAEETAQACGNPECDCDGCTCVDCDCGDDQFEFSSSAFFESERLKIFASADIDNQAIVYVGIGEASGSPICTAVVKDGKCQSIYTNGAYRRQGYATEFLRALEAYNGKLDLMPLKRTPDGKAFVEAYEGTPAKEPAPSSGASTESADRGSPPLRMSKKRGELKLS